MILYPNAKINIGLNVTEKRVDGYHNLETVFYPIKLCDVLEVNIATNGNKTSFEMSGIPIDGATDDNIVLKAYYLLQTEFDLPPVNIYLEKNIPLGAGLGGGSADAAFMLKALNRLFELNLTDTELENFASKLGADCPFFIKNKPVFATGIGNVFSPIQFSLKGYWLLLIKPDIHISTAVAYSNVKVAKPLVSIPELLHSQPETWKGKITNDFEISVFKQFPEIEEIKDVLYRMGAKYASMSGSGASVYGIFDKEPTDLNSLKQHFYRMMKPEDM